MGGKGSGYRAPVPFEPPPGFKAYERQPGESESAWRAFIVYRDLGQDRSLKKTAEAMGRKPGYVKFLEDCSSKYKWHGRVFEWDRVVDDARREQVLSEVLKMRERHVRLAVALLNLSGVELDKWVEFAKEAANKKSRMLSVQDIARLIEVGTRLERMSRGEAECVVEARQVTGDLERRSMRDVMQSDRVLKKLDNVLGSVDGTLTKRLAEPDRE